MKENICNINHKKNSLKIELNDLKVKPRDYKCPCGKAYLSYAALFTHIKQKHNGKAPGQISRPIKYNKNTHILMQNSLNIPLDNHLLDPLHHLHSSQQIKTQSNDQYTKSKKTLIPQIPINMYYEEFSHIFVYLEEILPFSVSYMQVFTKWESFKKLEGFLEEECENDYMRYYKFCLGNNLAEFLKVIMMNTYHQEYKFQQILILFLALLEYVIKENNPTQDQTIHHQSSTPSSSSTPTPSSTLPIPSPIPSAPSTLLTSSLPQCPHPLPISTTSLKKPKQIMQQCQIDILIEYINPFISYFVEEFKQKQKLENIWILKRQNINKVFMCFYYWLKWKSYTNFCITLIE